jgi:hypothetical protein
MNQALDNLAEQTLQITLQALAEKDQIIKNLRQKLANCTCQKEKKHA